MNINLITPIPVDNATSPTDHQDILIGDIDKIPANVCKSLIINQSLNYLTNEQLSVVISKMRHGGSIQITSLDAMEIARALYWGEINIDQYSQLTSNSKAQHSLIEIKNIFEKNGFIIELVNRDSIHFYMKVKRP
tara:strand:+ start:1330 stop:1734 length:405 start_codon:yes stop_codon:yes gene_type:complete